MKDKKFLTPKTYGIIGVCLIILAVLIFGLVQRYAPQKSSLTTTTSSTTTNPPAPTTTTIAPAPTTGSTTTIAPAPTTTSTTTTTIAPTYNYVVYYFRTTGYTSGGYTNPPATPQIPVTAMSSADLTGPDSLGNTYMYTGKSALLTTSTPVTDSTTARALDHPPYEYYAYNNAYQWSSTQGRVASLSNAVNAAGIPKAVGLSYLGYIDTTQYDSTTVVAFQANYILQ
jgi:hypothetical protein